MTGSKSNDPTRGIPSSVPQAASTNPVTAKRITVETSVAAPASRVWSAFTTPEDITHWNFASDDWCCPSAEVDLTVGGRYCARMEAKDGSVGFDFGGIYEEIEPGVAITLVLDDGRRSRTSFEVDRDSTRVTTVFDPEDQSPTDMQRDGWQAILNNLKTHVESPRR